MNNVYKKLFELRKLTGKVVKSKNNPFHKSQYADLNSVMDATDPLLTKLELLWLDRVEGQVLIYELVDVESGEAIKGEVPLILAKNDMQQLGSAITYARRYGRITVCGLQAVDDDAANASGTVFVKNAQIKRISDLVLETDTKADAMLSHYGVTAIKDLTLDNANMAEANLKAKKKAQDAKKEKENK